MNIKPQKTYSKMDNLKDSPTDKELSRLSPFELKNRIIAVANEKVKSDANTLLNAAAETPTGSQPLPATHSSPSASLP